MARNTSRFNKILNFIGLVDEQADTDGYDQPRPQGAQTYNPSARRVPQDNARPVRGQDYDDRQYGSAPRYDARQEYSAPRGNARDSSPRYDAPRERSYDAPRDGYRQSEYNRTPARPDYERVSSRPDYSRQQQGDRAQFSRADTARDSYYSQRQAPPRDYAPMPEPPRSNVVSLRSEGRAQTVIYYLHALEECQDVITDLLDNKTVLLNLEDMDERLIQRGIDTLCGAAFALSATIRKASDKTYLIAPNSVNVALTNDGERRY